MAEIEMTSVDELAKAKNDSTMADENVNDMKSTVEEAERMGIPNIEELKAKLDELKQEAELKNVNYINEVINWRSSLAKTLGIDFSKIDITIKVDQMDPKLQTYLYKLAGDTDINIKNTQKALGEEGKTLNDSPNTKQTITQFLSKYHQFAYLFAGIGGIIGDKLNKLFNYNSPKDLATQVRGCYQYNYKTGEIVFLGNCGFNVTNPNDPTVCCQKCITDSDCSGNSSGLQTCDLDTNQCIPCTIPNVDYNKQKNNISICHLDGIYYRTCDVGNAICGTCSANKGDDWKSIALCTDETSIIMVLELLRSHSDDWVPQQTPKLVYAISIIGLIGFILTVIWYIRKLIKLGKK